MLGYVDSIDEGVAKGWIVDERGGRRGLVVELWLDGSKVAEARADRRREDLFKFGLDGAAAGFAIPFAPAEHDSVGGLLRVVEASTGFVLAPGPLAFDPPDSTAPLDVRRLAARIARRLEATASLADLDAQVATLTRLAQQGAARAREMRRRFGEVSSALSFVRPETPTASIVISAGEGAVALHECLRALSEQPQKTSFEVVVEGGCPSPIEGVLESRAEARGDFLVFLDPIGRATAGWLDALIETFAAPEIGVVGAGVGEAPRPSQRYRRDAETIFAHAFAVRRSLYDALGGFRDAADLCARARAIGARVVLQPAASVFYPGAPALPNAPAVPRALFIDDWTPRPDRDAGSKVALQHMQSLQRLGFHVIFVASQTLEEAPGYTAALERIGVECVYAPYDASVEAALERLAPLGLIYLHRFSNADKYLDVCRRLAPGARLVYNAADLHALRQARARALGLSNPQDIDAAREFARLAQADVALVHSSHEAALVRAAAPSANVHCVAWALQAAPDPAPFAARRDIGFIGSYGHPPNADAMRYYARDILPAFAAPPPRLRMAGSGMTAEIRALANADIGAEGQIADLGAFLSSLRATVAPLRFGAGLKGKVLESLAQGTPCVMTPIAAEGLDLPETLQMLVAEAPAEIAARLRLVIDDEALWRRLSRAGLQYIHERYNARRIDQALAAAVGRPASE